MSKQQKDDMARLIIGYATKDGHSADAAGVLCDEYKVLQSHHDLSCCGLVFLAGPTGENEEGHSTYDILGTVYGVTEFWVSENDVG